MFATIQAQSTASVSNCSQVAAKKTPKIHAYENTHKLLIINNS